VRVVRAIAVAAIVAAAVTVALLVRGSGEHGYRLVFQNAGQLVAGDQVQVGGVPIGSVTAIDLTDDNQAQVTISVKAPYAPLHEGTSAEIRAPSLSGVANRYVALRLGANNAPRLHDGAALDASRTTGIVDVDQLFDTFDPATRRALQDVVKGSATQYAGAAAALQRSARYFSPALSSTDRLIAKLLQDQRVFQGFLSSAGSTLDALAQRAPELSQAVHRAAVTFAATASRREQLRTALAELPGTLRAGRQALRGVTLALPDLRRLVAAGGRAAPGLQPFLVVLRRILRTSAPALEDLGVAFRRPGGGDLVGATNALPALERRLKPASAHAGQALTQLEPLLQFIRPYTPDFVSTLRTFGQGAADYDANGHYARISPTFNAFTFGGSGPGTLTPNASDSLAGLQTGVLKRCPGSAAQAPPDGSAPFRDTPPLDCDPSEVPVG
jgi:phospholipid/cholesterol/gamma-HCH transport system substrate-binding protein